MDYKNFREWVEAAPTTLINVQKDELLEMLMEQTDPDQLDWQMAHIRACEAVRMNETDFYDPDSACFELDHQNRIQLETVDINIESMVEMVLDAAIAVFRQNYCKD